MVEKVLDEIILTPADSGVIKRIFKHGDEGPTPEKG